MLVECYNLSLMVWNSSHWLKWNMIREPIRRGQLAAALFLITTLLATLACNAAAAAPGDEAKKPSATPESTDSPSAEPQAAEANPTATETVEPTPTASPTPLPPPPEQIGPTDYPSDVNPLTGLTVDDPSVLERRPLLIKISNAPEVVRPQSGTSFADVIFEYYVEGGWTRFAAIFYGDGANHVGPVRSGRLVDLQIAPAFDSMFIFSGASLGVTDTIRESDLYPSYTISPQFGYAEPQFVRFPREGLAWEHTLYTDTDELWQVVEERGLQARPAFAPQGFAFDALPPTEGQPALHLAMDYVKTQIEYQYDPVTGRYLRWTDGIAHTDALTGEQLGFENVIYIGSTLEEHVLFEEKYYGAEKSLYIELQGSGPARLARDGQIFEGRWVREGESDMLTFTTTGGEPLLLKPGRTFIHIGRSGYEDLVVVP